MAGSLNKVELIGRLGQAPKLMYLPSGKAVCEFSLATSETWKDQNGERQERTEWHNIKIFGTEQAEFFSKSLSKGSLIHVCGTLRTRKWEKDGQTHYKTEIILAKAAHSIIFLDSKKREDAPAEGPASTPDAYGPAFPSEASDDDVPF